MSDEELKKHRGIYLLPNLFTTATLFAGFYAIVAAMSGRYEGAAIAIFIAMIMDGFDGRVARMTNTESPFGREYDSLSDMVAFGVAPGLVVYTWSLFALHKLGWIVAFIYVASVALRLARFNTQVGVQDKRYFQGLASPAGAAFVASYVWVANEYGLTGQSLKWISALFVIIIACLMVSIIRYQSFKAIDVKEKVPFVALLIIVLIFGFISIDPPQVLFIIALIYAMSGPVLTLWDVRKVRAKLKARKRNRQAKQ